MKFNADAQWIIVVEWCGSGGGLQSLLIQPTTANPRLICGITRKLCGQVICSGGQGKDWGETINIGTFLCHHDALYLKQKYRRRGGKKRLDIILEI
ncbi:hypothetical protein J6590_026504 [Homalodisca vitripennis]|nr:hypothetical protein J6590_026504 [Homalodisca vitripennis]